MSYVFINNGADHVDEHGVVHKTGAIIKTTKDLAAAFPNKFTLHQAATPVPAPEQEKSVEREVTPEPATPAAAEPEELKDVTVHYPTAQANDLLVLVGSDGFYVYAKDDLEEPLNDQPLAKKQVKAFVTKCIEAAA